MKEEINLLSPEARRARIRRLYRHRFGYLLRRFLFVWVILLGVFAGTLGYVWQRIQAIERQLATQQVDKTPVASRVREINGLMAVVNTWADAHPAWTPLVAEAVRLIPSSVRLEVVALQPENQGLLIRGVSTSRAAVVEMQQALEKLTWVKTVEAPLQNFAAGGTNEFSFTLLRKTASDVSSQ